MANNTNLQYVLKKTSIQVVGGDPTGTGTLLEDSKQTGGTFVANGATAVTVVEPSVTANSVILITLKTVGGTVGAIPAIQTITPGVGFTVAGTASDTSTYNYRVFD
jgi:hypothetical protein